MTDLDIILLFLVHVSPNMGGKSTTLRLACVATVMAQMGGYAPGTQLTLTPKDRIFTRLGAHDRILAGQSTFYVELEETATILKHATANSLVILDELGRGTSTFDGTAIAFAVIKYLTDKTRCCCMFSTHYAILTEEFAHDSNVTNYHMAAEVDQQTQSVTFLYRFVPGACLKSFGMNVARLAGLPESCVQRAIVMSDKFEATFQQASQDTGAVRLARELEAAVASGSADRVRRLMRH